MKRNFPSHLDPDNFKASDFEDAGEAFYWFGTFANKRLRNDTADTTQETVNPCVNQVDGPTKLGILGRRLPLCENAEFAVFDTETSGMSKSACAVQFALLFFRSDGSLMGLYDKLWLLPADVHMSQGAVRIHKITKARLLQEGVDARHEIGKVKNMFSRMLDRGKKLVAHNVHFDQRMLRQTSKAHGCGDWPFSNDQFFCTMQAGKAVCNLTSSNGRPKAPKNSELFYYLFGKPPNTTLHDAVLLTPLDTSRHTHITAHNRVTAHSFVSY
jgi:DNA polymerase III epsilon subunit-like protein